MGYRYSGDGPLHNNAINMLNKKVLPLMMLAIIQQLRGLNFTQSWPPTLLELTIVDILQISRPRI